MTILVSVGRCSAQASITILLDWLVSSCSLRNTGKHRKGISQGLKIGKNRFGQSSRTLSHPTRFPQAVWEKREKERMHGSAACLFSQRHN